MAQLLTAAAQANETYSGAAARDTVLALRSLLAASRSVAAAAAASADGSDHHDDALSVRVIRCTREALDASAALLEEVRAVLSDPGREGNQERLTTVARSVSAALSACVNCLPGVSEVEDAVKHIATVTHRISSSKLPECEKGFQEAQATLNSDAVSLNQRASELVGSAREPPSPSPGSATPSSASYGRQMARSSTRFSAAYEQFVESGLRVAGRTSDAATRGRVVAGLRGVSGVSARLLHAAKAHVTDPQAPDAKNQLTQAARAVTESINHLITVCTVSAPGQRECDNALREIQMMRNMFQKPSESISDWSYADCSNGVIEKSKTLAEAMTGISNHTKQGELDHFCECVRTFAISICELAEFSAHTAYLVGIADPASEPGRPGLVDQTQFSRANQAIIAACQNLNSSTASKEQVLSAATIVAKHTSSLCNSCRVASSKTDNPVAKRHFVQSAKDVANCTANLVKAIKALDSDYSEENRQKCASASQPLLNAVDELYKFASSPKFASVPGKISDKARKAQEPVVSAGCALLDGASDMIRAAKQMAVNPKDPPTYQLYSTHSSTVSTAVKKLIKSIQECAPGQRECEEAIQKVHTAMNILDQASLSALPLNKQSSSSLHAFQEQTMNSAREILHGALNFRDAFQENNNQQIAHLASHLSGIFEPLVRGVLVCSSNTLNSRQSTTLLDRTRTLLESSLTLLSSAHENTTNLPSSRSTTPNANSRDNKSFEAANSFVDSVSELMSTLEEGALARGVTSGMVEELSNAISGLAPPTDSTQSLKQEITDRKSYVDYQTAMVQLAKIITRNAQDMVGKCKTCPGELGPLAGALTNAFTKLASESRGAVSVCLNSEIASRLRISVQALGASIIELVKNAGAVQNNPADDFARRDLSEHAQDVTSRVAQVLASLQAGSLGTQACINAASTVTGIVADLDTTIMFATAGTLNSDGKEVFSDHRESILKTAKSLVEDTRLLVNGATSDQEMLAGAAQNAVITITRLSDCVKAGAASLGSEQPQAQVLLINAVKDVTSALGDLICATKNASGKSDQDPSMKQLMVSAKTLVTNATSLLKTVKTVEDEAARGIRAIETTIETIDKALQDSSKINQDDKRYSAEDLIRHAKPLTIATAKAVAAGNSGKQEDVVLAANLGRKTLVELLQICKGASLSADSEETRKRTLKSGKDCASAFKALLDHVHQALLKPSVQSRQKLIEPSKKVAAAVTEIVNVAEEIKGGDWVDPDDPTVVAETELISAANSIEAAAKKLSQLQPRKLPKEVDDNLNFDEQILKAAKSIAAATAALVKAASAAQRELVAHGKVGSPACDKDEDNQWSQGLISAARMVAAATHSLCDAANSMVLGHASEEKLISSSKQVASSTAQLLVACKVRAAPNSAALRRLQTAGNAVKRATEALVSAAQRLRSAAVTNGDHEPSGADIDPADEVDGLAANMVGGLAQIITAREHILIKEKELEIARRRLEGIRKAKYKDKATVDEEPGSSF